MSQCAARFHFAGVTYYCLRDNEHDGPHDFMVALTDEQLADLGEPTR